MIYSLCNTAIIGQDEAKKKNTLQIGKLNGGGKK